MTISSEERYSKKDADVLGYKMSYVDEGEGDPILLLHGNPTSSYLWRNVIPHLTQLGRCIAPDLIGMGDSDKLKDSNENSYSFFEHRKFLDAFLEQLNIKENVTLVIHDWGSALGFDWAYRNQKAVKGIAYMEAILFHYTWAQWPEDARQMFQGIRSEAGEKIILEKNLFIEAILPASIIRKLSEKEMEVYRRPFKNAGEDRRPTLSWPRHLPIENNPKEVVKIIEDYGKWLSVSDLPKLFINAEPGSILVAQAREFCRTWPNQEEVTVKGLHFIQEDSPDEIGLAVADFVKKNG